MHNSLFQLIPLNYSHCKITAVTTVPGLNAIRFILMDFKRLDIYLCAATTQVHVFPRLNTAANNGGGDALAISELLTNYKLQNAYN